ncbi:MAG: hybrid sensor histidine kinase/response regulator [Bdellovibrionota bacterium]|nr:hybrid sensor histidine kinase/response regulator [Bdellovibrionota bacterium]
MKILIVEDELIIASYMKEVLEEEGHHILRLCTNISQAMSTFGNNHPDLILLDLKLKGTDTGFEFAKMIREQTNTAIILVSANTSTEYIEMAKEINPNGFLSKPVKPLDLKLSVEIAYNHFVAESKSRSELTNLAKESIKLDYQALLGSFIHDILNPIIALGYNVNKADDIGEKSKEKLGARVKVLEELITTFRTVTYGKVVEPQKVSVKDLCRKVDLLNRYNCLKRSIQLKFSPIDEQLHVVEADVLRILSNLINNSIEAIENQDTEKWINISFEKVEGKSVCTFTDSGSGISKAVQEKLFEKGYSTKGDSGGAGFGLSTAKTSLEKWGHKISYNNQAANTQFILEFLDEAEVNVVDEGAEKITG